MSAGKEIARHVLAIEELTDYDRQLTFNVGQIRGGTSDNTVPERCIARVDVRVASMEDFRFADDYLRGLEAHDPDVRLEVSGRLNRPPYRKALAAELGFEIGDIATAGGSDGSLIANTVPTLDGLGVSGGGAHTLKEYLSVSSLHPQLGLMRRLMETLE